MMVKNSTTSKLDFLLLEEVSNESAEIISGGKALTLESSQSLDLGDPFTAPFDILTKMMSSIGGLSEMLGISLPKLPTTELPELPAPPAPPTYS